MIDLGRFPTRNQILCESFDTVAPVRAMIPARWAVKLARRHNANERLYRWLGWFVVLKPRERITQA